mmetsp:Transcript_8637/g.25924  ORF Transcript_8637/g.25924 Transcript_8637/m.25924 type:complete len:224 (+) Transcript_8637:1391-2062(+)
MTHIRLVHRLQNDLRGIGLVPQDIAEKAAPLGLEGGGIVERPVAVLVAMEVHCDKKSHAGGNVDHPNVLIPDGVCGHSSIADATFDCWWLCSGNLALKAGVKHAVDKILLAGHRAPAGPHPHPIVEDAEGERQADRVEAQLLHPPQVRTHVAVDAVVVAAHAQEVAVLVDIKAVPGHTLQVDILPIEVHNVRPFSGEACGMTRAQNQHRREAKKTHGAHRSGS